MNRLKISLLLSVILSVICLGWVINVIGDLSSSQSNKDLDNIEIIKLFIQDYTQSISHSEQPDDLIRQWPEEGTLRVEQLDLESLGMPPAMLEALHSGEILALETNAQYNLYSYLPDSGTYLKFSTHKVTYGQENYLQKLLLTTLFYLGILIIIVLWLSPLVRQLLNLRQAAQAFGNGEMGARIASSRWSYISEIEKEFNQMADKIESLLEDNKLLSRAVSHELKTPIARLRFGVDALYETQDPQRRKNYIQRIESDLDEMEGLVDSLLNYARLEEGRIQLKPVPVKLSDLVLHAVEMADTHQNNLIMDLDEKCQYSGDYEYLQMLVSNLVVNACKYSEDKVLVRLNQEQGFELTVEDNGPGIPEENREQVFKPFWRDANTSSQTKGFGIGMAIAARIAEWHGLSLTVTESEELAGAKFILKQA